MDEVEKLLLIRIKEKELDGDSSSEGIISEKALYIYADELKETPSTCAEGESWLTFKASKFQLRSGIHSVVRHGEAARSNKEAAEKYVVEFRELVNAGGHLPQQVLNCVETALFWKNMLNKTYTTKEEISLPGHKPMRDRITILECTNGCGDCEIRPMFIYHSENPRTFERSNVMKSKLPVIWQSNLKSLYIRQLFVERVCETLGP